MEDYNTIRALIEKLRDRDDEVRFDAVLQLRERVDLRATEDLLSILSDARKISPVNFDDLQFEVINLIEQCGPAAIHRLAIELENKDQKLRETIAYRLQFVGEPALPGLLRAFLNEDKDISLLARNTLLEVGESAVPYLVAVLNNNNNHVRREALRALCFILEDEAEPYARVLVSDPDDKIRAMAQGYLTELQNGKTH